MRSQVTQGDCGPGVHATGALVAFHYVLAGRVQLRLGKPPQREAGPGALILLARNEAHLLSSERVLSLVWFFVHRLVSRPLLRRDQESDEDSGERHASQRSFVRCVIRRFSLRAWPELLQGS